MTLRSLFIAATFLLASSSSRGGGGGGVFAQEEQENIEDKNDNLWVGSRDRFWRHHVTQKSLVVDGVDHYSNIESCVRSELHAEQVIDTITNGTPSQTTENERRVRMKLAEPDGGPVFVVAVQNAMSPEHVKSVQSLAKCVRKFIPSLYESRAMYQEMNLEEDPGLGGNCPTHLAPLISIFLPEVVEGMQKTLEFAYQAAGWSELVQADKREGVLRNKAIHEPSVVGMRASEHLTYKDFPSLDEHTDGDTVYTMNFAFSGPEDYDGGEFFIISEGEDEDDDEDSEKLYRYIKPEKYDALVFLGGRYLHGVSEITGGHREMYSTEFWPYPDTPFGSTLWTNTPENMKEYIRRCNKEKQETGKTDGPCMADFPTVTAEDIELEDIRKKYAQANKPIDDSRPNRVKPDALTPVRFRDDAGKEYDLESFRSEDDEPDFLIPKELEQGELVPIRWRDNLTPVDGSEGESFVIGFPPELLEEFQAYIERSGMMEVARKILYEDKELEAEEHRLYTLDDGMKWGAMVQGDWETDMVWLDPADEECFESLLAVLRRGGFDTILDKVGKAFDLNGLMIQGVGAIFLSEYEVSDNMHVDIEESKGSFYNIIVPIHIPDNDTAKFYVGDQIEERRGQIDLKPNVGIVLGGESQHGTGECDYTEAKDFRLSFAIYVADINEDNIDLIASDSTSLWPTGGDTDWFWAQQGRLWTKDGRNSLKNDKGRKPLNVQDSPDINCSELIHLCEKDLQGMRLRCPKTCQLYMEDNVYYSELFPDVQMPTCPADGSEPSCVTATE